MGTEVLDYPDVDTITPNDILFASKVILFNDNEHSFDDVIGQLIKAINCSYDRAEEYAFEVHNKGKSCVYDGDLVDCLKVSEILEEIALHTQIES